MALLDQGGGSDYTTKQSPRTENDMITFQIIEEDNIVIVELKGPLSDDDFQQLTPEVDLHLVRTGTFRGLLIHARDFPGWENLKGMVSHLRFVRDHHHKIEKVALVSDSALAGFAPKLVDHFVNAEVKGFKFDERDSALAWLRE